MDEDIEVFVKACIKCAKNKTSRQKSGGLLQPLEIPAVPWEEIRIDLIVGLRKTPEDYEVIVTVVCRLTNVAHFIPAKIKTTAEELAQLLSERLSGYMECPEQ